MLTAFAITTILVVLVALLFRWRRRTFSYFKDLGIPGPEPNLIWGNLREYHENGLYRALDKWCGQYGDIFGFYNGDVPTLVVRDLDFLQYVFVKNLANFTDRGVTMRTDEMHPFVGKSLLHAKGSHWKSMRTCVTSGFTTLKLKQMMAQITQVCDVFMEVLEKKAESGRETAMLETFQALMMDYMGQGAFGIDTSFQNDLDNPLFSLTQCVIEDLMTGPFHVLAHCTTSFGVLAQPLYWLNRMFGDFSYARFAEPTAEVIELRKQNPALRRVDILQSLIDAEYQEQPSTRIGATVVTQDGNVKPVEDSRSLSSSEVIMNATTLFIAGFETTSTALSYVTFALGKYPDIQERVRQEVKEATGDSGHLDYETLTQRLKYLGQVVNEALRIWPPALTFTTRQAKEDFEYQGTRYKAGTSIMAPTLQIHRDERFFADPLKFDPDRFNVDGSFPKLAYQPFGIGSRNCIGSRIGMLEMTYTIARMTQQFRWELGSSQKGEMHLTQHGMASNPATGPWIVLHRL